MKKSPWLVLLLSAGCLFGASTTSFGFGRGGFGGGGGRGGGFGGGGGGFAGGGGAARNFGGGVGSTPSFNRPQMPQGGFGGGAGGGLGAQGLGGQGLGNRGAGGQGLGGQGLGGQGLGSQGRAGQGLGAQGLGGQGLGSRSPLQDARPGLGNNGAGLDRLQGLGGQGLGGQGLGAGNGLNGANRDFSALRAQALDSSGRLPGMGAGAGFGLGGDAAANRAQTLEQRQGDLSQRMASGREDWQSNRQDLQGNRQDMQGNRQDWRDNNREDWQNWADNTISNHGDWYHDCWHDNWYPGAGWNNMWNNYPVAAAFGVTAWGVNRIGYSWGYWGYYNPYYTPSATYNYSQPIVIYQSSGEPSANGEAQQPVQTSDQKIAERELAKARDDFFKNNFDEALRGADRAVRHAEHDAAVHEFRGLTLFAVRRYAEAASAVYGVLSAGPGWDWTTMSTLYSSNDVYTGQLRGLEEYTKTNPASADGHFLLGYHYLVAGHPDQANGQFVIAQQSNPDDRLLKQLVAMTTPPKAASTDASATPAAPAAAAAADPGDTSSTKKAIAKEVLYGHWKASQQNATFDLTIKEDGSFIWLFERDDHRQSVRGVFAVDQNQLALQPDSGGAMLADITMFGTDEMQFKMISGDSTDAGMRFKKVR